MRIPPNPPCLAPLVARLQRLRHTFMNECFDAQHASAVLHTWSILTSLDSSFIEY